MKQYIVKVTHTQDYYIPVTASGPSVAERIAEGIMPFYEELREAEMETHTMARNIGEGVRTEAGDHNRAFAEGEGIEVD